MLKTKFSIFDPSRKDQKTSLFIISPILGFFLQTWRVKFRILQPIFIVLVWNIWWIPHTPYYFHCQKSFRIFKHFIWSESRKFRNSQPHSTNACQDFMEEHFPAHTPTLWRFEDSDPLFFGPKWDDFWSIERLWAIQSQRVYRNPRPTHIKGVMRRLREEVKNTDPKTLTRLVHALPAKMNEIYRLKGKKIPSNFDPRKSSHACKCSVCESWDLQCKVEIIHKMFENSKTFLKMKIIWSMGNSPNFSNKYNENRL